MNIDNNTRPPKAKILTLTRRSRAVVTQKRLEDLENAQVAEWHAGRRAALLSEAIRVALEGGASVEPGRLYFDDELRMVRSRKKGA